jgi:raffinose/stachyose/melibiose transport system substrate-binding protein
MQQQQSMRTRRRRSIPLTVVTVGAMGAVIAAGSTACSSAVAGKKAPTSKELVYWSMWQQTEPQAVVIQKALTSYSESTGVKVTAQWHGRNVLKDLAALTAGAVGPDLVDGSINTVTGALVAPGRAADLTAVYSQPVPGENALLSDVIPDKYLPLLSDQNNRVIMVPYEVASEAFFFDSAKQPQLAGGGKPTTWAKFVEHLAALKKAGQPPLALDPIVGNCAYWTEWVLERELGPGQIKKTAEEKTSSLPAGAPSRWDDPAILDGAQKIEALIKAGYFAPGYLTENVNDPVHAKDQQNGWAKGAAAIVLGGTWTPSETAASLGANAKNIDAFIFPTIPGADGKGDNGVGVNFFGFAVPRDGKHPDAAQNFILYFMNKDRLSGISTDAANMTPRPDIPAPGPLLAVQQALTNRTVFPDQDALMRDDSDWYTKVFQKDSQQFMLGKLTAVQFVARLKADSAAFWAGN